jgi:uncharacterized phage-associated protein
MSNDPRAIANLILAETKGRGFEVSNLKLQKLLFLCHALYLVNKSKSLIHGSFEAWQYGPVSREVYDAFRSYGDKPIQNPAKKTNPVTGKTDEIPLPEDKSVRDTVTNVIAFYGHWTPRDLVSLTHAKNGPWDFVVENSRINANIGLKISESVIRERFKYLWFGAHPKIDMVEPNEDRPLT